MKNLIHIVHSNVWGILIAILIGMQSVLTWCLRTHLFFNDDLETIAYGKYFSTLYVQQFDMHMPLVAFLSWFWGTFAGFGIVSNRIMAGVCNALILLLLYYLSRRFYHPVIGLIAAVYYLAFESVLWSFCNISEIYSVLFGLVALAFFATGSPERRSFFPSNRGSLLAGIFFGLSAMSRIMSVEMLSLLFFFSAICTFYREGKCAWKDSAYYISCKAAWLAAGFAIPLFFMLLIFTALGSVSDFLYWSLLHGFKTKSGINLMAWVGDLSNEYILSMWYTNLTALSIYALGYALYWRRKVHARYLFFLPAVAAFSGWLGANPSGIGGQAMHAIPAFPFLGIMLGLGLFGIWSWAFGIFPRRWYRFPFSLAISLLPVLSAWPILTFSLELAAQQRKSPHFEYSETVSRIVKNHSTIEETIFVFGANPYIYVSSERNSATFASILFDGLAMYEDNILSQLKEAPPRFVVVDRKDYWYERNLCCFPRLYAHFLEHYRVNVEHPDLLEPRSSDNQDRYFIDAPRQVLINRLLREIDSPLRIMFARTKSKRFEVSLEVLESRDLEFQFEKEWKELFPPLLMDSKLATVVDNLYLVADISVMNPGKFNSYPVRFLFDGIGGRSHQNAWSHWVYIHSFKPDHVESVRLPLSDFVSNHGSIQWDNVTNFQIGGWGPAGGVYTIHDVRLFQLVVRNFGDSDAISANPSRLTENE